MSLLEDYRKLSVPKNTELGKGGEEQRKVFVAEQKRRAEVHNELRTGDEKLHWQNEMSYIDVAKEEAEKVNTLIDKQVKSGEAATYTEAMEKLMHLEEFQLKDEKQIISEENWKSLPTEAVYARAEKPKSAVPVFLMPGWANTASGTFKESIDILNKLGRDVVSVDTTRAMEILATGDETQPVVEIQKAMAILKVLEEKGIKKTDLLVHSEAGINGLIAASMQPEKFRKIILAMPAGIIGKDSFLELAGRFSKEIFAGVINIVKDPKRFMPTNTYLLDLVKYVGTNPMLALKEVIAISRADTSGMLKNLREQGIEIKIIAANSDPVFTPKRIRENLAPDSYDDLLVVDGSHGEIFMKAQEFMELVDVALNSPENSSEKK